MRGRPVGSSGGEIITLAARITSNEYEHWTKACRVEKIGTGKLLRKIITNYLDKNIKNAERKV